MGLVISRVIFSLLSTELKSARNKSFESPSTSISTGTSANVKISTQNFLAFSFNHIVTLVWNFKATPSSSPKLLNLNQEHLSKNCFFRSNPYKIEVMITFLIKMLELPNFGHLTTSTIWFDSRDKTVITWHHGKKLWRRNLYFKIPLF